MREINKEFFPVAESKTVEVRILLDVDQNCNDIVAMRNAADALKWRANSGGAPDHMTFVRRIEVIQQ